MKKELEKNYRKMIENIEFYKALTMFPLKSDIALKVDKTIDQIEYYAKIYYHTWKNKRQLTDEEKQHLKFQTPESNTLKYFHSHRSYRAIHESLSKLITRIQEIHEKEMNKENEESNKLLQCSINFANVTIV